VNTYEDKYLREKVSRIIARQKEGRVLVAAYKDGSGLVAREELGQELTRAAFPYDYAVGKAGYLTYNAETGAYFYTARPGEKLPAVLANCRTLCLAEARLDVAARCLRIHSGDTCATFTNVQPWKGLHEVLRAVNEELARQNAGIVVWKIVPEEDAQARPPERLFAQGVPKLRNGQAMGYVTGYACDANQSLAYVGVAGYKTSLESLRVTLMAGKPLHLDQDGAKAVTLLPCERYEQAWQAMPEYTSHHAAFVARQALPGKWEPEDACAYLLAFRGGAAPEEELLRLFVERIKEALEAPVLDEWGAALWRRAGERGLVQDLTTAGDCLRGACIDLTADWQGLLAELLAEGTLTL